MLEIGTLVRILPPFADSFPGPRVITEIVVGEDGTTAYFVAGVESAFDAMYLEIAE